MRKQLVAVAGALGAALTMWAAPLAPAGPVSLVSGRSVISFNTSAFGSAAISREMDIRFPGSADFMHFGDRGHPPGFGRVNATDFIVSFATDRPLHYHLEDTLLGVSVFKVGVDDFTARAAVTLRPDDDSILSGSWPTIPGERGDNHFGDLDRDGLLPAGTRVVSVRAEAGMTDDLAASSARMIRLALADDPEPLPIPLPPALWTGLGAAGAYIGLSCARRLPWRRPQSPSVTPAVAGTMVANRPGKLTS